MFTCTSPGAASSSLRFFFFCVCSSTEQEEHLNTCSNTQQVSQSCISLLFTLPLNICQYIFSLFTFRPALDLSSTLNSVSQKNSLVWGKFALMWCIVMWFYIKCKDDQVYAWKMPIYVRFMRGKCLFIRFMCGKHKPDAQISASLWVMFRDLRVTMMQWWFVGYKGSISGEVCMWSQSWSCYLPWVALN